MNVQGYKSYIINKMLNNIFWEKKKTSSAEGSD